MCIDTGLPNYEDKFYFAHNEPINTQHSVKDLSLLLKHIEQIKDAILIDDQLWRIAASEQQLGILPLSLYNFGIAKTNSLAGVFVENSNIYLLGLFIKFFSSIHKDKPLREGFYSFFLEMHKQAQINLVDEQYVDLFPIPWAPIFWASDWMYKAFKYWPIHQLYSIKETICLGYKKVLETYPEAIIFAKETVIDVDEAYLQQKLKPYFKWYFKQYSDTPLRTLIYMSGDKTPPELVADEKDWFIRDEPVETPRIKPPSPYL